jgi:hypothetical protein
MIIPKRFEVLLPAACQWATENEAKILELGISLSEPQLSDAELISVSHSEDVRLLEVDEIPKPDHPELQRLNNEIGFITDGTQGLTLGHGIYIRRGAMQDRELIVHELVHVAQYEQLGGIRTFLIRYLMQCLAVGYKNAPMETIAKRMVRKICR